MSHDTGKAPPAIPGTSTSKQAHEAVMRKVPRGQQKRARTFSGWLNGYQRKVAQPTPTFDDFERLADAEDRRQR